MLPFALDVHILDHRFHQILSEQVPFNHRSSVFYKAIEVLPGGLLVVFPLDLELDLVLVFRLSDDLVTYNVFDAVPSSLL